jgi:hypothetical protein
MADNILSAKHRPEMARGLRRLAPWLSRLVMFPPVVIFTLIALRYFTNPTHATSGTTLNTPEAFTDTRVIGAWILTLLFMLVTFLLAKDRLWLGHLQLAFFMGAALAVRVFGFVNDGTTLATGNQRVITVVEIIFLILNSAGLFLQSHQRTNTGGQKSFRT